MIKVSVITVVLNGVEKIEDTIKSVKEQSIDDVEYIIIDGGSTDGTIEIIRRYENDLSYWVSEPDSGIYDAMNKALNYVHGDVVAFINAGDTYADSMVLSNVVNRFQEDNRIDILIGREIIEGKVCNTYNSDLSDSIFFDAFFPHQATFIKANLFKNFRKYNNEYKICADYDWVLGAYVRGFFICWCDDVFSIYDSSGISSSIDSIAEQYFISRKYLSLSGNNKLIKKAQDYYIKVYSRFIFREILRKCEKNDDIKRCLEELIDKRNVAIWGAGYFGGLIHSLFEVNGIYVEHIIDSDTSKYGLQIGGTSICGIDESDADLILIATIDYENEVVRILNNRGLCEYTNYITFTEISLYITRYLTKTGYDDGFRKKTGLIV